jgi:hypothetical protein
MDETSAVSDTGTSPGNYHNGELPAGDIIINRCTKGIHAECFARTSTYSVPATHMLEM